MEYHFRIVCLILGIMGVINSAWCMTELEIDKIVERKMETERLLFWRRNSMRNTLRLNIWKRNVPMLRKTYVPSTHDDQRRNIRGIVK